MRGIYIAIVIAISCITVIISSKIDNLINLFFIPIFLFSIYLIVFRYPEISFILFLTAGVYKADPRLSFLPEFLDLTVMFGLLAIIGVAYGILMNRIKFCIPSKQVLVPYFIIVLLAILSLTYTSAPIYGTDKLLRFLTITSLAFFIPFFLLQKKEPVIRFFIGFIVLSLLMIFDILSGGLSPGEIGFHGAFGSNYLAVGRIAGTALIIICFYFLMSAQSIFIRLFWLCLIPLMTAGIFLSGGRGPLLSLVVSILTILVYIISILGKRFLAFSTSINKTDIHLFILIVILIAFGMGVVIGFSDYLSTIFMRLELLGAGGGESVLERVERFKKAIEAMVSFPTSITGLGIGGFGVFYESFDDKRGAYPHNIFLEIGSELGILGLFAFLLLIYWSFSNALFNIKKSVSNNDKFLNITFLSLFVFMLINSSVSGDINDNRLLFTWIGLIYASRRMLYAKG